MAKKNYDWIALGYTVPALPSKSRVYVWRKLKECGAEYWKQGVAVLPNTPYHLEEFLNLSAKIHTFGGEATLAEIRFFSSEDTAQMVEKFRSQAESEYRQLMNDCGRVLQSLRLMGCSSDKKVQTDLKKMEKRYRKVRNRSFLSEELALELEQGFSEVKSTFQDTLKDLGTQIQEIRGISETEIQDIET